MPRFIASPLTLLAIAGCALVFASPASAETFCVSDPGCAGTTQGSVGAAILAANNNGAGSADRIQIGPGVYADDLPLVVAGNQVEIVGAGSDQTTIARQTVANNSSVL